MESEKHYGQFAVSMVNKIYNIMIGNVAVAFALGVQYYTLL